MYLADYRAVEYLASRPDWTAKTLVVMGTSMGGQQSLAVAGLNPKITHLIVNEPAGVTQMKSARPGSGLSELAFRPIQRLWKPRSIST